MDRVLLTVRLEPGRATREDVCARLGVAESDLDPEFGVVLVDPQRNLYAVLVDEAVAPRAAQAEGVSGPYANPSIRPAEPPEH
jgi:hypothetical protein